MSDTTASEAGGTPIITDGIPAQYPDIDEQETREWLESLDAVTEDRGQGRGRYLMLRLLERARQLNIGLPSLTSTDYINTIPPEREPEFPGDEHIERRIRAYIRWNAAVMVHRANIVHGVGGHIGSYASAASLYEVGFNHFFRGRNHPGGGDQIYIQGHASPGIYARSFLEGRLTTDQLDAFRREVEPGGLPSYPHPRLMPDYWEFPTVSMGFAALHAIYQARYNRYLENRGFKDTSEQRVWAFLGDGETAEPETLGALNVAAREGLDNLTFILNCNLQQLDGPVRGNGKIMQEMEGVFRGAGWNVIKVVWGSAWDELLAKDVDGLLVNRMNEVSDGQFQTYTVKSGSYIREDFFGTDPRLLEMVEHLSDEDLENLPRGGHDYRKVYAAFKAATEFNGGPTVIMAQTIKGWTLGPDFEARNAVHQMKKLNEKALKTFRDRLFLDISDEQITDDLPPYITFDEDSEEQRYLMARREELGGSMPDRRVDYTMPELPDDDVYASLKEGSGNQEVATTMALVRLFKDLFRHKGSKDGPGGIGKRLVPIIPDEARTFGMDAMFPTLKLYSPTDQNFESVDSDLLLSYKMSPKGQILHEGITEAGSMASFHAVGSSYATHGEPMIPLYLFYSMFGFQRTGDQIWSAADQRARGFLIGATAGGTTLNGEGLQHQDRHSLLLAQSNPAVEAYDASFAYELAVLMQNGIERMYSDVVVEGGEDVIFYLTVYNEPRLQPAMPEGLDPADIVRGIYRYREGTSGQHEAHIFSSGTIMYEALRAQELLAEDFDIKADVWSAPGWNRLLRDGTECEAWNRMNPDADEPLVPEITTALEGTQGPYVAVSDWLKATPVQIADWIPGRFAVLGTDGFGRSDTREQLRRFHRIDAESIAVTVLAELAGEGIVDASLVSDAITKYELDELQRWPFIGNRRTGDITF